jgi:hypothetical protein
MGPEGEKIFERAYQLHLEESGEKITFNDFFDRVVFDEEFAKYFDTLFERSKRLVLDERRQKN